MHFPDIRITSFGFLRTDPPAADLVVDLRHHFRDPQAHPELRGLTAYDPSIRAAVMATRGVRELTTALVLAALAYRAGPVPGPVTIAIGCTEGRHRAPTVAMVLADYLHAAGLAVEVDHRDISAPVVSARRRFCAAHPEPVECWDGPTCEGYLDACAADHPTTPHAAAA